MKDFILKYEVIVEEMRLHANDSEFGEHKPLVCNHYLNQYQRLTNGFMELVRFVSLEQFTRDAENISTAIDEFLSSVHNYEVRRLIQSSHEVWSNSVWLLPENQVWGR